MEETPRDDGPDLVVDCNECVMKDSEACGDCVVSFVLDRSDGAIVFDAAEERAIRTMTGAGLLPLLRWEKRTG